MKARFFGDSGKVAPPGPLPGTPGWDDASLRGRSADRSRSQAIQRGASPKEAAVAQAASPDTSSRRTPSGDTPVGTTPSPLGAPSTARRHKNPLFHLLSIGVRLIIAIVILVVIGSAIANQVTARKAVAAKTLYPGPYVTLNGRSVAYAQWGTTGKPVVLIPGLVESTNVFEKLGPVLAARGYHVYSLDLPGFGYTERKGPYGLKASVAETEAFIQKVVGGKPLIVGHSFGAAVGAGVMLDDPQLGSGLVMVDGDGRDIGQPTWLRSLASRGPVPTAAIRLLSRFSPITDALIRKAYAPVDVRLDAAARARWTNFLKVPGAEGSILQFLQSGSLGESLETLTNLRGERLLVVFGENDGILSPRSGNAVAAATGATFSEIPNQGHLAILTKPSRVAGIIDRWYTQKPG